MSPCNCLYELLGISPHNTKLDDIDTLLELEDRLKWLIGPLHSQIARQAAHHVEQSLGLHWSKIGGFAIRSWESHHDCGSVQASREFIRGQWRRKRASCVKSTNLQPGEKLRSGL